MPDPAPPMSEWDALKRKRLMAMTQGGQTGIAAVSAQRRAQVAEANRAEFEQAKRRRRNRRQGQQVTEQMSIDKMPPNVIRDQIAEMFADSRKAVMGSAAVERSGTIMPIARLAKVARGFVPEGESMVGFDMANLNPIQRQIVQRWALMGDQERAGQTQ